MIECGRCCRVARITLWGDEGRSADRRTPPHTRASFLRIGSRPPLRGALARTLETGHGVRRWALVVEGLLRRLNLKWCNIREF